MLIRDERCRRYEAAYEAANGFACHCRYDRRRYRVNRADRDADDFDSAFTARELDSATLTLEARAAKLTGKAD